MRISDWSSDVCSSDLAACQRCRSEEAACQRQQARRQHIPPAALTHIAETDKGEQASPRAGAIETADARRLGHAERRLPLERAKHFQPAGQRLHDIGIGGIAGRAHRIDLSPLLDYRSEEHTSEPQSLMRISYAVFCLKKKNKLKN